MSSITASPLDSPSVLEAAPSLPDQDQLFQELFDHMLNGAALCKVLQDGGNEPDFVIVRVNQAFSALTGLRNIAGRRASRLPTTLREVREKVLQAHNRIACSGRSERFEVYVAAYQMWLLVSVYSPQQDCFVAMFDVVTARKTAEMAAKKKVEPAASVHGNGERFLQAMEGFDLGYWEWNLETQEFAVSPRFEAILGYELGERDLSPANWTNYIHPDDLDLMLDRFKQHLQGHAPVYEAEMRCRTKAGGWKWILSRGSVVERDERGQPQIASGVNTDISARKMAEEELRLAHLVYRTSSEAMTVTDADGVIIAVNPAFTVLTGYAPEEVIGKTPRVLKSGHHDRAFYNAIWEALKTTGRWEGEIWNRRKNGEIYPEWLKIDSTYNADGSVHRRVALFSDITKKKALEELLWRQANVDLLTGMPNRRMFLDRLEQEIRKSHRADSRLAVLFLDLDNFKNVNDLLGHARGDKLLQEASRRLSECLRECDTIARFGGDEFAVLLAEVQGIGSASKVAEKVLHAIADPFLIDGEVAYLSASVGITLFPDDSYEAEGLLMNADHAMYAAKQLGRNRYNYFTPEMQQAALTRTRLANDMRSALAHPQFEVHYQPIVELASGRIHKAEALLRWRHPVQGMISPADFIPLAEEIGLIIDLGDWVFKQAAQQVARLRALHDPSFQISVNKSPVQFRNDLDRYLLWLDHLRILGLKGDAIIIEVTESLMMDGSSLVENKLNSFCNAGMQIALDDFGTGYASLSYLKRFDFDYIKIDQSFVRNLEPESDDMALCEAIILMAHKLGIKVVAEGVETERQRDLLCAAGCDYAQGYLFSRPLPAEELENLLRDRQHSLPPHDTGESKPGLP